MKVPAKSDKYFLYFPIPCHVNLAQPAHGLSVLTWAAFVRLRLKLTWPGMTICMPWQYAGAYVWFINAIFGSSWGFCYKISHYNITVSIQSPDLMHLTHFSNDLLTIKDLSSYGTSQGTLQAVIHTQLLMKTLMPNNYWAYGCHSPLNNWSSECQY